MRCEMLRKMRPPRAQNLAPCHPHRSVQPYCVSTVYSVHTLRLETVTHVVSRDRAACARAAGARAPCTVVRVRAVRMAVRR